MSTGSTPFEAVHDPHPRLGVILCSYLGQAPKQEWARRDQGNEHHSQEHDDRARIQHRLLPRKKQTRQSRDCQIYPTGSNFGGPRRSILGWIENQKQHKGDWQ